MKIQVSGDSQKLRIPGKAEPTSPHGDHGLELRTGYQLSCRWPLESATPAFMFLFFAMALPESIQGIENF